MGGNFSRDTGQSEALQSAAAMVIPCCVLCSRKSQCFSLVRQPKLPLSMGNLDMVPWAHPSLHPKRHVGRSVWSFCGTRARDQQTCRHRHRHRHGPRNVKTSAAMSRIRANHATTTRDVRTVDASACGRRSARNLEIGGLTPTARARKFADAD